MESQIKKITNKELDDLTKKNELPVNSMNSLGICIPYEYFIKLVCLNWYDILFAVKNGFLPLQAVVEYSVEKIKDDETCTKEILDLACITKEELIDCRDLIYQNLRKLAEQVSEKAKSTVSDKILYVLLSWVFDHRNLYEDPLEIVEFIYDDFNFPKSISSFIKYMPIGESKIGSSDLSIERLFRNWEDYLRNEKDKYLK